MADGINILKSNLERVFSKDLADVVAEADGAAGVIPGLKRSVHVKAGAAVSSVAPADYDAWEFSSKSVIKQVAWGELLGVQSSPAEGDSLARYISKYDSLPSNSKEESIQEGGRKHRGHLRLRSRSWANETIEHGR